MNPGLTRMGRVPAALLLLTSGCFLDHGHDEPPPPPPDAGVDGGLPPEGCDDPTLWTAEAEAGRIETAVGSLCDATYPAFHAYVAIGHAGSFDPERPLLTRGCFRVTAAAPGSGVTVGTEWTAEPDREASFLSVQFAIAGPEREVTVEVRAIDAGGGVVAAEGTVALASPRVLAEDDGEAVAVASPRLFGSRVEARATRSAVHLDGVPVPATGEVLDLEASLDGGARWLERRGDQTVLRSAEHERVLPGVGPDARFAARGAEFVWEPGAPLLHRFDETLSPRPGLEVEGGLGSVIASEQYLIALVDDRAELYARESLTRLSVLEGPFEAMLPGLFRPYRWLGAWVVMGGQLVHLGNTEDDALVLSERRGTLPSGARERLGEMLAVADATDWFAFGVWGRDGFALFDLGGGGLFVETEALYGGRVVDVAATGDGDFVYVAGEDGRARVMELCAARPGL